VNTTDREPPMSTEPVTKQPSKAMLYLRVSTSRQVRPDDVEGLSIPEQRLACQQKAASLGAEVAMEYVERESAKTASKRPALQRMLAELKLRGDIDYVIVWKIDRFARNRFDEAIVGRQLEELGAQFVSVSENIDSTPAGQFLRGVLASHAEYDNAIRAERARLAMTRKAQLGGTPYKPPPGYTNISSDVEGRRFSTVEIDTVQAPLMATAFRRYSGGDMSLVTLSDEMYTVGLRSHLGGKICAQRLHVLLQSHYYLGKVPFRGVIYDGKHPALIDRLTFDRVQEVMKAHSTAGEKRRTHNHYLKGTIFCGNCGGRMIYNLARNKQGNPYPYFFCLGRREGCQLPHLAVEDIEKAVERYYRTIQFSATTIAEAKAAVYDYIAALKSQHGAQTARHQRRLASIEKKFDRLFEAYAAEAMTMERFKRQQDKLDQETTDAKALLDIASGKFIKIKRLAQLALSLVKNAHATYMRAEPLTRRMMNQTIFTKLLVTEDGVVGAFLTQLFADLMSQDLIQDLQAATAELKAAKGQGTKNPDPLSQGRGWNEKVLARQERFELPTFGSVDQINRCVGCCGVGRFGSHTGNPPDRLPAWWSAVAWGTFALCLHPLGRPRDYADIAVGSVVDSLCCCCWSTCGTRASPHRSLQER
jgi:site-specific DNA recombinase